MQPLVDIGQSQVRVDVVPVDRADRFQALSAALIVLELPLGGGDQLESYPLKPPAADFLR
jgi:hypothetical protein